MTDLRKAAHDVVKRWDSPQWTWDVHTGVYIEALRQALQAEPEPVAWAIYLGVELVDISLSEPEFSNDYSWKPLYTTPPSVAALIAEIDEILIGAPDRGVAYSLRRLANKYRSAK